jgi:hypothetical protein
VLVGTPVAIGARPVAASNVSAVELAGLMQGSAGVSWCGYVETSGTLQVPDSDAFVNLAQLLGENRLRVWWRSAEDWRVDRIRCTGETDLFRKGQSSVRWVFESERATVSRVSEIRLPDASDLLPPTLARALLQGLRDEELSRLPTRRLAGIAAPGVRLVPADTATALARVDLWADPQTGLPRRVELYGTADERGADHHPARGQPGKPRGGHHGLLPAPRDRGGLRGIGRRRGRSQRLRPVRHAELVGRSDVPLGRGPRAVGIYGRGRPR